MGESLETDSPVRDIQSLDVEIRIRQMYSICSKPAEAKFGGTVVIKKPCKWREAGKHVQKLAGKVGLSKSIVHRIGKIIFQDYSKFSMKIIRTVIII